jgi:hypothetical protein
VQVGGVLCQTQLQDWDFKKQFFPQCIPLPSQLFVLALFRPCRILMVASAWSHLIAEFLLPVSFFASYACMMMVALVIAVGYYLFVHRQTPIAIGKLPQLNRQHLRIIFIIGSSNFFLSECKVNSFEWLGSLLVCWIFGGLSCLFAVFTGLLRNLLFALMLFFFPASNFIVIFIIYVEKLTL